MTELKKVEEFMKKLYDEDFNLDELFYLQVLLTNLMSNKYNMQKGDDNN